MSTVDTKLYEGSIFIIYFSWKYILLGLFPEYKNLLIIFMVRKDRIIVKKSIELTVRWILDRIHIRIIHNRFDSMCEIETIDKLREKLNVFRIFPFIRDFEGRGFKVSVGV
jgi:hypothetical protein